MNLVEIETAIRGAGDRQMTVVNGVERAAENSDAAWMMFRSGAMGLRGGQCCSGSELTSRGGLTEYTDSLMIRLHR
jgi:hypothetical protein